MCLSHLELVPVAVEGGGPGHGAAADHAHGVRHAHPAVRHQHWQGRAQAHCCLIQTFIDINQDNFVESIGVSEFDPAFL